MHLGTLTDDLYQPLWLSSERTLVNRYYRSLLHDVPASISNTQRRLERLDSFDEEYRQPLHAFLSHPNLKSHVEGLQGVTLGGFVELLDKASEAHSEIHECWGGEFRRWRLSSFSHQNRGLSRC
ncbi:hypothetical protein BDM02DRAFT_1271139 [Thelephora ganbajun]|uniref:Uncharacterized protein n=1 Tax=Thelephora ganbajun TaxID=370292 RepID=A0ACB6Z2P7_THEGA|nr:hypothetical protein BDM02DRAFT_1271139 [Thelephora ganbajun]